MSWFLCLPDFGGLYLVRLFPGVGECHILRFQTWSSHGWFQHFRIVGWCSISSHPKAYLLRQWPTYVRTWEPRRRREEQRKAQREAQHSESALPSIGLSHGKAGQTPAVLTFLSPHFYCRRKFRSQTSDNMEKQRWEESEKRREEKKREDQRRERARGKKMQVRKKLEKSRCAVFFQCFGAQEGRKVGSLKRRVRSHLARWEMKNCTPLWREAHFEVKMYDARSTFGSWAGKKVHAVVARSTFPSQNVKSTTCSDHL